MGKVSSFGPYPALAGGMPGTGQTGNFALLTYNACVAPGLPTVFSMITLGGLPFHSIVQLCLVYPGAVSTYSVLGQVLPQLRHMCQTRVLFCFFLELVLFWGETGNNCFLFVVFLPLMIL